MVNTGSGTIQNAMFKGAILKLKKICFKNISKIKSEIQIQTATYKLYIHEYKHQSDRGHRDKYKITFQHPNLEI